MKFEIPPFPEYEGLALTWGKLRSTLTEVALVKGWQEEAHESLRCDGLVHLEVSGRPWTLVVEWKTSASLREIQSCHWDFHAAKSELYREGGPSIYGILLCPYVSEEAAKSCEAVGIGYLDEMGNMHLAFDGLFLSRRVAEKPKREKQKARTLYSPQASRVLRALLSLPIRPWKVQELHEAAGVSLGLVSRIGQSLMDDDRASKTQEGIFVNSPELLLREWMKQPVSAKDRQRWQGFHTLLSRDQLESKLKELIREIQPQRVKDLADPDYARVLFGSFSAAKWIAPFAKNPNTFLYADDAGFELLKSRLGLQSVETGATVFVCVTDDPTILDHPAAGTPPDIRCAGLVQTALDLAQSGDRGREAAEELINQHLKPLWRNSDKHV